MAMNSHFSEEFSEDIDIYGDLDDVEVRIQGTELITSSGNLAEMWFPQTKYGESDAKDIETVVKIHEQAVSNELELYTELLAADYKKRRKEEDEELKHFKNTMSENEDLRHKQESLEDEMRLLKSENTVLRQNISSLYKTAKCEIDFKNALISELRTELDGYIFRRSEVPYNNRCRRQTTGKARYDKSYKDPEYESSIGKSSGSRRSSSLDVNPSIAFIKQIYKDSSEKGEGSVNWRDIENVLKSALHEFMDSNSKTSKLDESVQNGKNQACLIENLKKIMLSGKSNNQNIGNTIQATKETSHFQSQKRHFTRKFATKKYNNKTRNHSSFKKTCLSSSEKLSLLSPIQPCHVNERDTKHEQNFDNKNSMVLKLSHLHSESSRNFSNSMKADAIKLFAYHNTDVPFAVKRKLGIPISKDGTRNAIELLQNLNLSSKPQRTPHKVPLSNEQSITESMPLKVSSEISSNLQSDIRSASLSQITNLVTACTTVNSLTSYIITNSAISALVDCNRDLPIEMNPNPKTAHKRTRTKRNSSQISHHEKEFHRSKGDIQQVSDPLEVNVFPKQNSEENAEMNALLDFGLQLFDDSFEEIERSSPNAICVTELEQSNSSPKINFADGQFNLKHVLLPTIDYTVTPCVASNKTTPCATSNTVTSCTVSNIVTPYVTSNTVASSITSSTMTPYVTASTMTTYVTASTMTTYVTSSMTTPCLISNAGTYNVFSDTVASSVACNTMAPTVRSRKCKKVCKRDNTKKEKSLCVSLDPNKQFCLAKNDTEQVCVPTNELNLTLEQSSEADSQMNIDAILDFGLQMFSDIPSKEMKRSSPNQVCTTDSVQSGSSNISSFGSSVTCATSKSVTLHACDDLVTPLTVNNDSPIVVDPHPKKARRRTSMKKKKSSQTPSLHKKEFNLSESNIQQLCDMTKELDEPVKQNVEEKCDLNFIVDFGLQMLDDPFEGIKRTSSDEICNVEAHSLYPTDSSTTSAICSVTIPNIKDSKKTHKRADTKRMSSKCKSSAKRKRFRLTENRTENPCVPPKKLKVSLKQNEIENNKMDAIFDLGLKMLDDPFSEMF